MFLLFAHAVGRRCGASVGMTPMTYRYGGQNTSPRPQINAARAAVQPRRKVDGH
jgi:hypothetical protein